MNTKLSGMSTKNDHERTQNYWERKLLPESTKFAMQESKNDFKLMQNSCKGTQDVCEGA